MCFFFFSSRRRHTRFDCDWSSDVCSSDLLTKTVEKALEMTLPLAPKPPEPEPLKFTEREMEEYVGRYAQDANRRPPIEFEIVRSEERRVGKECRSGWWP